MESLNNELAILVMSCDKYKGVWDDFFNLKEKYWQDCPYKCYLATDSINYEREGVTLLHFGNTKTWTACVRKTLDQIKESYVAFFLEDAFIYKTVDTSVIDKNLSFMIKNKGDFFTMEKSRIGDNMFPAEQIAQHIWRINKNCKYGIETSAAIWNKSFFYELLSKSDCSAWQFEVNLVNDAMSEDGLPGNIYCDDRTPFNISPVEVIRVGKLRPQAIKFFKNNGYDINIESMPLMNHWEVFKEFVRDQASKLKFGRVIMKTIGKKLGFYTYTTK